MKHAKHGILMVLACMIPLALIFFLPALGLTGNGSAVPAMFAIFGAHLLMMRFMHCGRHGTHSGGSTPPAMLRAEVNNDGSIKIIRAAEAMGLIDG